MLIVPDVAFVPFYPGTGLSFRIFISSSAFLRASSLPAPVLISSISFPLFVLQCLCVLFPPQCEKWLRGQSSLFISIFSFTSVDQITRVTEQIKTEEKPR